MNQSIVPLQKVYNLIVLDESGSMESIRWPIVKSFNELVGTIAQAAQQDPQDGVQQEHFVSLYTFNSERRTEWHFNAPASVVQPLNPYKYCPDACTPLYDAMGYALCKLEQAIAAEQSVVLVTILTDGLENASVEYDVFSIKALVNRLKEKGWVFTYMGTEHDVQSASSRMGVMSCAGYDKNDAGLEEAFAREKHARTHFYQNIKDPNFNIKEANENYFKPNGKPEDTRTKK